MRWRGQTANLALACAASLTTLLLVEIALRLFLPPPPGVTVAGNPGLEERLARERQEGRKVEMAPTSRWKEVFVQTPTGRRMRANMRIRITDHMISHREVEIRTNALGYRGPEIGPKTRTRVLFLGDSITLGHFLPEEETFVRRVEALSETTARSLETINAGIAAAGLQSELAILTETGLRTEPDVVVVDFYLNDVQGSPGVFIRRLPKGIAWSRTAQYAAAAIAFMGPAMPDGDSGIEPAELDSWRRDTMRCRPPGPGDPLRSPQAFNRLVQDSFADWGSAWSEGAWERMKPCLVEFERLADTHRFSLAFVMFPVRHQVEADFLEDSPQRRLKEIAREMGVPVLDLLPVLRGARASVPEPLFFDVCHPTTLGNAIIAGAIEDFLQGQVLGPAGPSVH